MSLCKSTQFERGSQDFFKKLTLTEDAFLYGVLFHESRTKHEKKVLLLQEFIKKIDSRCH